MRCGVPIWLCNAHKHSIPLAIAGGVGVLGISSPVLAQAGGTLDVPAQIGSIENRDIAVEDLTSVEIPNMSRVIIESIAAPDDPQPLIVTQPGGTRDLCDPKVADWERQQVGVDCTKLIERRLRKIRPELEAEPDPLFTNRSGEVEETFENLGLGEGVPSTVILQN